MGLLFGRRVELRLYTATEEIVIPNDYDISFEVFASTKKKTRNHARITIAGLSESQRALFGTDLLYLELWAGYGDEIGVIFRGSWDIRDYTTGIKNIRYRDPNDPNTILTKEKVIFSDRDGSQVKHTKSGPVWQTEIQTSDGIKETQIAFFNKSYPAGTTLYTILRDLFAGFGLPVLFEFARANEETLNHGATFTGRSAQILDDLSWSYKFDWTIQNGSVLVTEKDEPSQNAGVTVVLSHSTGLIGDPAITAEGVECRTMMLSMIKPKGLIEIKNETVPGIIEDLAARTRGKEAGDLRSQISQSGVYVVDEITYYGDNRAGDYNCIVKALFE